MLFWMKCCPPIQSAKFVFVSLRYIQHEREIRVSIRGRAYIVTVRLIVLYGLETAAVERCTETGIVSTLIYSW